MIGNIDLFQDINETYGNEAANSLLKALTDDFPKLLRSSDYVAHWRKDDFLFLLPEVTLDGAKIAAERIRQTIEKQLYYYGDVKLWTTMTFGVSTIRVTDRDIDLLGRVNNALFKGKEKGGNCVISA